MSRALFQVLVICYRVDANCQPQYLLLKRSDLNVWQWIAGGGENKEIPEQTARREALEEAGIPEDTHMIRLDSMASIPVIHFADHHLWATDVYVIPEYGFAIEVKNEEVRLSGEHSESAWLDYETARSRLGWDSNKTALWELHSRLSARRAEQGGHESRSQVEGSPVPATIHFIAAVPQFSVPDLVRTAEYYRDVLGFQIAGYWDGERVSLVADSSPVFAIVWRDQVQVFFNLAHQSDVRAGRTEDAPDIYLRVVGIDALAEELRARGADILDGPEDRIYGQREVVIKDCNGLILCFGEDTSGRAA